MLLLISYSFISVDEVYKRFTDFTIVDVRSSYEYRIEHIKGALSAPVNVIETYFKNNIIPNDKPIVFYCVCPHHLSEIAASKAESYGFNNVYVLNEGFFGWRDKGYPTDGIRKGEEPEKFTIVGYVKKDGNPVKFSRIWFIHKRTGQMEVAYTTEDGFYKSDWNFFNIKPGDTVFVSVDTPDNSLILVLPKKMGKVWGSRVDILDGKLVAQPGLFNKTLKEKGFM